MPTTETPLCVLPVDKPVGPTSHDVVARARRALSIRRIGHTGTLDPFASGLLLLCIGDATRIAQYLVGLDKRYIGALRLGVATDTDDRTGSVISIADCSHVCAADITGAFAPFIGTITQVPPTYSARKVGGERMHSLARRGIAVEAPPAVVDIHSATVLRFDPPDVEFSMECSSGTYVRSFARDVGAALGTGAHLTALRRTRIGRFDVEAAVAMESLEAESVLDSHGMSGVAALAHLPKVDIDDDAAGHIAHGRRIRAPEGTAAADVAAIALDDVLIAVAAIEGGIIRPAKVLRHA
jgi:tRNA pseudouridine55 synthase